VTALRILNGLKRGASLPLNDANLLVGASFSNDIVMLDQGIADQHFEIKRNVSDFDAVLGESLDTQDVEPSAATQDGEFVVQPINGLVTRLDGSIMKSSFILEKNQPFLVGDIWFVLHDNDTAWPEKLPQIQIKVNTVSSLPNKKSLVKEILAMHPIMLAGVFSIACFIFLGFRNVSYATMSESEQATMSESEQATGQVSEELAELRQAFKEKKIAVNINNGVNEAEHSIEHNKVTGQAFVNSIDNRESYKLSLGKMIKDREISGVDIEESSGKLLLNGEINEQHKDKLARMLERYRYENKNSPEVVDKTTALALKLPFEIKSVVSGPYGHVRLNDGQKLLLGESLSGYQLASINDRTIVFVGKNKIEVNW
jgi:predicted XRE-type DNA-binding protein